MNRFDNPMPAGQAASAAAQQQARLRLRHMARRVLAQPGQTINHRKRLEAATHVAGEEPLQGCLVDLFSVIVPSSAVPLFELACDLANKHLPPHIAQVFDWHFAQGEVIAPVHALATRWSVLVQPSAAVPARLRRASSDESRLLAQRVLAALQEGGERAQTLEQEFLAHCLACHDRLAFMLARREWLRTHPELTAQWQAVAEALEQDRGPE
ncbi:hypothetical protein E8K88_16860 [Lampropedia aestuarii]|uniref:Uncharacterized protein n=1 Tax=Lampropedia aestuarii TaxID=2562762 RepID=A0A4S5BEY5_9BURK|nr:hypothetical protein [Lampropedia aestuarii]MDH5857646.1 hypothetical protein [Lampropedia aestuarii]THJ30854.1 hypothetical protein E8K88_16860 [Lampropedia aestuarii]